MNMKKIILKLIPILAGIATSIFIYYRIRIISPGGKIKFWYNPWYIGLLGLGVYIILKLSLPYYQEIGKYLIKILKGIGKKI